MFDNDTLLTETLFRQKCRHFYRQHECSQSACIFVPINSTFYYFEFGTGDNLLPEDIAAGYDGYINIESYRFDEEEKSLIDTDGGMFLFTSDEYDSSNSVWTHIPFAIKQTEAFDIAQKTGHYPNFLYI